MKKRKERSHQLEQIEHPQKVSRTEKTAHDNCAVADEEEDGDPLFSYFPNEILQKIFRNELDVDNLLACSLVNWTWRRTIFTFFDEWTLEPTTERSLRFLTTYLPHLKRLGLLSSTKTSIEGMGLLTKMTALESLMIWDNNCLQSEGYNFLSSLTGLKELEFNKTAVQDSPLSCLSKLTGLERLVLYDCRRITDNTLLQLHSLQHLQHLDIALCTQLTNNALKGISALTQLTDLDVSRNKQINDHGLQYLSNLCNLKALNLTRCKVKGYGFGNLTGLSNLQSLRLSSYLSEYGAQILITMTTLRSLSLSSGTFSDGILSTISNLCNLTELSLFACHNISNEGVDNMIQRLPLLTTLNLGCCSQLSDCAFNNVTALQQLKITDLSFCSISDKTMKLLGKSTSLQELDVSYCSAITNLGLMHIAAVTTLQQLRICGCRELKGDTVKPLTSLVNLKSLEVSYTKIPKQHLDELSQVLPRLSIFDWGENF